jgi:hypothetical protein
MKRFVPLASISIVCGLISACASMPNDPDTRAQLAATIFPVETRQEGDYQLSCADLSAAIKQTDWTIAALDKQIARAQNAATGFAVLGALADLGGAHATNVAEVQTANAGDAVANLGGALSAGTGTTKQALRANYEARHETLISVFYSKPCVAS